jgi:hypothetical protein
LPITCSSGPSAAVSGPRPTLQTSVAAESLLVATVEDGLGDELAGCGSDAPAEPEFADGVWPRVPAPELPRERLWPGFGPEEQFSCALCVFRAAVELTGRHVGVVIPTGGGMVGVVAPLLGVVAAEVVELLGVVVPEVVEVVGVVVVELVVGVVELVVGVVELVVGVVEGVVGTVEGVVVTGVVVVSVRVVPAVVASAGAGPPDCAPRAAVPPAIQPLSALDIASVPASNDSRERRPARGRRGCRL